MLPGNLRGVNVLKYRRLPSTVLFTLPHPDSLPTMWGSGFSLDQGYRAFLNLWDQGQSMLRDVTSSGSNFVELRNVRSLPFGLIHPSAWNRNSAKLADFVP